MENRKFTTTAEPLQSNRFISFGCLKHFAQQIFDVEFYIDIESELIAVGHAWKRLCQIRIGINGPIHRNWESGQLFRRKMKNGKSGYFAIHSFDMVAIHSSRISSIARILEHELN